MLLYDGGHHLGIDLDIGDLLLAGSEDLYHRLQPADADTAGLGDGNAVKVTFLDLVQEGGQDRLGAGGDAAGGHADGHTDVAVRLVTDIHLLLHLLL